MCDKEQPCGLQLPQLALKSDEVLRALMLLSLTARRSPKACDLEIRPPQNARFYTNPPSSTDGMERLAILALFKTHKFIQDSPRSWEPVFADLDFDLSQPSFQSPETGCPALWVAMLATFAKLGNTSPRPHGFYISPNPVIRSCVLPHPRNRLYRCFMAL